MVRSSTGRKVFVTNLTFHDFSPAREFGDLVIVTNGTPNLMNIEIIKAQIDRVLSEMVEEDYLLIAGSAMVSVLCLRYLFDKMHGTHVRLLYWNAQYKVYVEEGCEGEFQDGIQAELAGEVKE